MNEMSPAAVSGALYREAMSRVAEQVHVIATGGPAGRSGATATAVASVSDAPPSLLVCLNRRSGTLALIEANGRFSVNVLAAGQQEVAAVFAGAMALMGEERFRTGDGWRDEGGVPVLADAASTFVCRATEFKPVGSHVVIFGEVEAVRAAEDAAPLLYHRRSYRSV